MEVGDSFKTLINAFHKPSGQSPGATSKAAVPKAMAHEGARPGRADCQPLASPSSLPPHRALGPGRPLSRLPHSCLPHPGSGHCCGR